MSQARIRQVALWPVLGGLLGWLACGAGLLAAEARPGSGPDDVQLSAGRMVRADGALQDDALLVIRDGKITQIDKETTDDRLPHRRFGAEAVICPGLVDLLAAPGAVGQLTEDTKTIDPEMSPARALDAGHPEFRQALQAGITAVMVGPTPVNLVNGTCVTVRTHGKDGRPDILRDDGPLLFAFGEGVWRSDRAPTSRAGALFALRELIAEARRGAAHARVSAAVAGKLDAWVVCADGQDVRAIRQVLGDDSTRFGVLHTEDAVEQVAALQELRQPVVLGPYSMDSSQRVLLGARTLVEAGTEVAFRAGFPQTAPDGLRLTAALAVRQGMDPAAARRAITIAPARVAGVADRIGSIEPGKDADLVVFSQDPLRLDARVLEVYIRGQRVYAAD